VEEPPISLQIFLPRLIEFVFRQEWFDESDEHSSEFCLNEKLRGLWGWLKDKVQLSFYSLGATKNTSRRSWLDIGDPRPEILSISLCSEKSILFPTLSRPANHFEHANILNPQIHRSIADGTIIFSLTHSQTRQTVRQTDRRTDKRLFGRVPIFPRNVTFRF
jgi:hypothetical protein